MDYSGPFLFSELFCGPPPSCLKVIGWVGGGGGGGLQDFSVSPGSESTEPESLSLSEPECLGA